jgi:molybdopterin-binding protein
MKLSARNQIAGTVKTVKPGATTTHVTIEVSPTVTITASITNEAAEELGLKSGMTWPNSKRRNAIATCRQRACAVSAFQAARESM